MSDGRAHVPLGADVELYKQVGAWAPGIAGFAVLDLDYDTPGLLGKPGVDLAVLAVADVVLFGYLFVVVPFDEVPGASGYLTVEGVGDEYVQSYGVDGLNDWQSYDYASVGEALFGRDPLLFRRATALRFYVGDSQGDPVAVTHGRITIVLRILPALASYPAEPS